MDEYIDGKKVLAELNDLVNDCVDKEDLYNRMFDFVDGLPTADVVEVKYGEWIAVPSSDMSTGKAYKCSNCEKNALWCKTTTVLSRMWC